jgi:hypothetical protein
MQWTVNMFRDVPAIEIQELGNYRKKFTRGMSQIYISFVTSVNISRHNKTAIKN